MDPGDLGLPPKFSQWRTSQYEALLAAASSEKRFVILSLPPGVGKSAVYMALARLLDCRAAVLTFTKGLQAQLMRDFGPMGLFDIRGQNNYPCCAESRATCDEGPCHVGVSCPLRGGGCVYYDAVARARNARLVVTNYAYWMTQQRYAETESLGRFELLVCDEAHGIPERLAEFASIYLPANDVGILGSDPPVEDRGQWSSWADGGLSACAKLEREAKGSVRAVRRARDLATKLKLLRDAGRLKRSNPADPDVWMPGAESDWIGELDESGGARFSPIWAHGYAEQYLFARVPKVVLTSATVVPRTAHYLGLTEDAYSFHEFPSPFNPRHRPVYWIRGVRVGRSMTESEVRVWLAKIDQIIDRRLDRKGIIHTRSYERAKLLKERSRHSRSMIVHTSRTTREQVERFKLSRAPSILVSPSVEEGWDFPYAQCSYIIIAKVPFADMRPAITQMRKKTDKRYLDYLAALALVQASGRGMRSKDDRCEVFIVDDHIQWFIARNKAMLPAWWRAAFKRPTTIPPPLPGFLP